MQTVGPDDANRPALRRASVVIQMSDGTSIAQINDTLLLEMVQNRELPPNRRQTPIPCTQRALQLGGKALAAATLVYALWSVINYIAPRGDSSPTGLPRQPEFDFDHL